VSYRPLSVTATIDYGYYWGSGNAVFINLFPTGGSGGYTCDITFYRDGEELGKTTGAPVTGWMDYICYTSIKGVYTADITVRDTKGHFTTTTVRYELK
jgi:hypothetical protein